MSKGEPHRVRLRRPWRFEPLPRGLCWRRSFHRPTGLGAAARVWIVVDGTSAVGSVTLNDHPLGRLAGQGLPSRFEVTGLLKARNELVLAIDVAPRRDDIGGSSPPGEVWIEISSGEY